MKTQYLLSIMAFIVAGLLVFIPACSESELQGNCSRDSDCDSGFLCSADHLCLCTTDDACSEQGQFCNSSGFCQKYLGCRADADCGDVSSWRCMISESGSGQCLCKSDNACEDGEFCNTAGSCQKKAGCILDSDCGSQQDWRCKINADTSIGECFCNTDNACVQGEFCNVHGYCQPNSTCDSNDDCPAGRFCNVDTGECLCNPDSQTGCAADEVCNSSGYCQQRPGCYDNGDCEDLPDTYCDYTSRKCVANGTCTSDTQCQLGQICRLDQGQYRCIDGCNSSSDCPLDEYCSSSYQCTPGCQADDFCGFTEFCSNGSCTAGYSQQSPYCKACSGRDLTSCGPLENSCLIYPFETDPFSDTSDEYCAPDCSGNQRCPNGFSCRSVIGVKQSDICHSNSDCPAGLPCLKSPEEDSGYCPCHNTKNPCMSNTCLPDTCSSFSHKCAALNASGISLPCQTDADCHVCSGTLNKCGAGDTCPEVQCEIYDGADYGGCVVAKACGLMEGFHCPAN